MNICILENLIAVCLISLYNITVIGEAKFVNVVVALFSVQSILKGTYMPVPLIQVVNYLCIFLRTTFIELFMSESNIGAQNYGIKRIFLLLMTAFYVLNR